MSTLATDAMSVTFEDEHTQMDSEQTSVASDVTKTSNITSASTKVRLHQLEVHKTEAESEIATLKAEVLRLSQQLQTKPTNETAVTEGGPHTAGEA